MTVYVDNMMAPFGRMKLSHMIADTEAELHAMAADIGVRRKWYQGDHYDVSLEKRALAIKAGAQEITWRACALMMMDRRRNPKAPLLSEEDGLARIKARLAS